MKLKLLDSVPTKKVVFDKDWDVAFDLKFLGKTELQKMTSRHTKIEFNRKSHSKEEELDVNTLRKEMCERCVLGWHGVTYKYLQNLVPLDMTEIDDINEVVEFSQEALDMVVTNSYELDSWIFETVKDVAKMTEVQSEAETQN